MRVSGCNKHNRFVLSAGAKVEDPPTGGDEIPSGGAKSVTNNIPILSVLGLDFLF